MAKTYLSYDEVTKRFPRELQDLRKELRGSRSKRSKTRMRDLEYYFSTCVRATCVSAADLFKQRVQKPKTIDERVADLVSRTEVYICAQAGRWQAGVPIDGVPLEVVQSFREGEESFQEKMSGTAEDLMKSLSKKPGFAVFVVSSKEDKVNEGREVSCLSCGSNPSAACEECCPVVQEVQVKDE